MSLFDEIKKAFVGDSRPADATQNDKPTPVHAADTQTKDIEKEPEGTKMALDEKSDFSALVAMYKRMKGSTEVSFKDVVLNLNPTATPHRCPHCGIVHDFTATRARKCPSCGLKMVVRQGLFVTEEQALQIEAQFQKTYSRQFTVNSMGNFLESAQAAKVNKRTVDQYRAIAQAYRYAAQLENHKDSSGFTFWDKAWGYYGKARLEEMRSGNPALLDFSCLPDILWDMTQMLRDQAASKTTPEAKNRDLKMAIHYACMTIAESCRLGTEIYFSPQLYTFTKECMAEISMTVEDFRAQAVTVAEKMRLTGASLSKYESHLRELEAYEVLRPSQFQG